MNNKQKFNKKERTEFVKNRMKDLSNKINEFAQELANLTDDTKFNSKFLEFVDFQKKFWRYSVYNQILIQAQKPNCTYVASFKKWKELGRYPVKDSSIWILAPMFFPDKEKVILTNGNTFEIEEKDIMIDEYITGFKSVPIYDISDTQGKEVPDLEYELNTNNQPELLKQAELMLSKNNIKLMYKELGKTHFGYTDGKIIVINNKLSIDDKLHTILHEKLHHMKHFTEDRNKTTKKQRETEAEAASYIVCRILNITPSKSYNYLALYNSDSKLILKSLSRINKAIKIILQEMDLENMKKIEEA